MRARRTGISAFAAVLVPTVAHAAQDAPGEEDHLTVWLLSIAMAALAATGIVLVCGMLRDRKKEAPADGKEAGKRESAGQAATDAEAR